MLRRVFKILLCMIVALNVTVAPAAVAEPTTMSPVVNVKYIHDAILAKWNVSVGYNSALTNKSVAANMKYLLAAIDVANKKIGGSSKVYSGTSYATSYAVNKQTADNAIKNLIKKPRTFPFTATTSSDTSSFSFKISAEGEFWVDWGDGSDVQVITKSDTNAQNISHTYTTAAAYTIRMGGRATKYYNGNSTAAISFLGNTSLASVSGSLGKIFPTLSSTSQPRFYRTFYGCTNLTSVPETLLSGVYGAPIRNMFTEMFYNCTALTEIPAKLFSTIRGAPAMGLFNGTFYGCTGLTSIPDGLFSGLSGAPAGSMFRYVFYGCSGLTGKIPSNLFGNISGEAASSMYAWAFEGCSGLTGEIPLGLFGNLSGERATTMFYHTFYGCKGLYGKSARNPDGTYLYEVYPSTTNSYTGYMYTGTCLEDNASIPSTWGGKACTYVEPEPEYPFELTTTSDTSSFSFNISAAGKFYVNWGDGSAFQKIEKTDTTNQTISHTYTTAGAYAVRIGGRATGYASSYNESNAAISFKNNKNLAKISGSLGEIFPTVNGRRPIFRSTFYGCTNLTGSIPEKLFSGISGAPVVYMFASTFRGSSGLTGSIPSGLFGNISGAPAAYMFDGTFNGCTGLTGEIPSGLFGELSGAPAASMFGGTFRSCSGLTGSIPSGLFGNITGAPATYMFDATFNGCSGLTGEIPSGLFGELSGAPAYSMFGGTFRGCSGLTGEIPLGLFGNLSGTLQNNMFTHTFNGCSGLTGKSARSPDGTYLYDVFPSATSLQVGDMYTGTCLEDNASIPSTWGGKACTYVEPEPEYPFELTTTSDTSSFSFNISAAGTFYVNWGDGTAVETITKADTTTQTISHTYATAAAYNVRLGGVATAYPTSTSTAAISFRSTSHLTGISGSLGAIFPTLANGSQPSFNGAFYGSSTLRGSIPENLFAGIHGAPVGYMFNETFSRCSGLTGSIPENLFAGIKGAPADDVFSATFSGCSGLTGSIPEKLFAGIAGAPARDMFSYTFNGCTGLTSIPENLFVGIKGAPASNMFYSTFSGCTGLTSIPENLFVGIKGAPADTMFRFTFGGCTGLTSIPEKLFAGIAGAPARDMFSYTFSSCTGLTGEIPAGLFGELSGAPAYSMFGGTFRGCSGLTGEIPLGLFGNLSGTLQSNMFTHTFNGCSGLTGKSARSPDGTYLYNAFSSATSLQVGNMYTGTCLEDNASIPSTWGGKACTYTGPIPPDEVTDSPFTVTTTSDTSSFAIIISAAGRFYVDWGDGDIETITKTDTDEKYITHDYGYYNQDTYTIKIGGKATAYSDGYATIRFDYAEHTEKISGSLGAIFPTLADGSQPNFYQTFYNHTKLTSLPEGLFTGIKGAPTDGMFQGTFASCENLTGEIPLGFFGDLSGKPADYMFVDTFSGCSGLTGPSARNPDGTYLYNVFPSVTSDNVGGMYTDVTELSDYNDIPDDWK